MSDLAIYDVHKVDPELGVCLVCGEGHPTPAREPGLLRELAKAAVEVMDTLDRYGPSIVPHLIDSDENAGQRLRDLAQAALSESGKGETE